MKRSPHQITFVILVSALVLSAGFVLSAERERTDESSAPQSSVTIEQAIAIAKEKFPGHVLEAELENEDDNTIFEIKGDSGIRNRCTIRTSPRRRTRAGTYGRIQRRG